LEPIDPVKSYAAAVQSKDKGGREIYRAMILHRLKASARERISNVDVNDKTARNEFIDTSVSAFLDLNASVTDARIDYYKEKHPWMHKLKTGVSSVLKYWKGVGFLKKWLSLPGLVLVGAFSGAFLPGAAFWISTGTTGILGVANSRKFFLCR
jgi:hypothetical protein